MLESTSNGDPAKIKVSLQQWSKSVAGEMGEMKDI